MESGMEMSPKIKAAFDTFILFLFGRSMDGLAHGEADRHHALDRGDGESLRSILLRGWANLAQRTA
jgi:hypothetical protein